MTNKTNNEATREEIEKTIKGLFGEKVKFKAIKELKNA